MRNEKLTLFISAEKLRLVRRFKTSIAEFKKILEFDPEDAGIMEKIGDVYLEWNKPVEGLEEFRNASNLYIKKAEWDKALKVLDKIISHDTQNEFGFKNEAVGKVEQVRQEIAELEKQARLMEEEEKRLSEKKEAEKKIVQLGSPLFLDCSIEELSEIVKVTNILELSKSDVLFREGDQGDSLYLIESGAMEVMVSPKSKRKEKEKESSPYILEEKEKPLAQLERGDFFGEISFLSGSNRTATLIAKEDTRLFEISREDFSEVLKVFPQLEQRLHDYYKDRVLDLILAKSVLFSFLDKEQRIELRNYFVLAKYNKGEVIIEEGSTSRDLYLIKYGIVKVVGTDLSGNQIILNKLKAHAFFGEVSFLTGKPRTASVIASTPVELLIFSHDNLIKLIDNYPKIKDIMLNFQKKRAFQTIKKFKLV